VYGIRNEVLPSEPWWLWWITVQSLTKEGLTMMICPFYMVWLLNGMEIKGQISNWFAILEIINDEVDITESGKLLGTLSIL
jgi:hypothetical protein